MVALMKASSRSRTLMRSSERSNCCAVTAPTWESFSSKFLVMCVSKSCIMRLVSSAVFWSLVVSLRGAVVTLAISASRYLK